MSAPRTAASTEQTEAFRRDGYFQVPAVLTEDEVAAARDAILEAATLAPESCTLSTGGMQFYSNLLPHSPALRDLVGDLRILDLVLPLAGGDAWVRWDQAVVKGPGAPTFPWHQDNGYNRLRHEHFQVWVALSESTPDNGGLWVVPGSHDRARSHHRTGEFEEVDGDEPHGAVCLAAGPGDVTVFSSLLLHTTRPNVTDQDRWAYVAEYVRLAHHDPFVWPPYLVVARRGQPAVEYVRWFRGRLDPIEQARYLRPRLRLRREEGRWRRGRA
jgi:hypothetical protein